MTTFFRRSLGRSNIVLTVSLAAMSFVQSDAFAGFLPPDIAGLQLWYNGSNLNGNGLNPTNGALVSSWADLSGNGLNATQAITSAEPTYVSNAINGQGGVLFGTVNGVPGGFTPLSSVFSASLNFTESTIFMVANDATSMAHVSVSGPGVTNEFLLYNDAVYHHSSPDNYTYQTPQSTPSGFYIQAGVFGTSPSDLTNYINGVANNQPEVTLGTPTDYTSVSRQVTIGGRNLVFPTENFQGTIAEIIVYDTKLSSSDIATVDNYLSDKYGIPLGQGGAVPEPAGLTLLAIGVAGIAACTWRRRNKAAM